MGKDSQSLYSTFSPPLHSNLKNFTNNFLSSHLNYVMFGNHVFIWKFGIGSNLLFGKSKNFIFEFRSNSIIAKVVYS